MFRTLRLAAALLAACFALVALAACGRGGDDGDSSYKKDAQSATAAVSAVGPKIEAALKGAAGKSDAAVAAEFSALKAQSDAALKQVQDLEPSTDADKALVESLDTALTAANGHLGAVADAAAAGNATAAQGATTALVESSPAVASANAALKASVDGGTATTK